MFIIYTCTHILHLYIQNTCAHMYVYIYMSVCNMSSWKCSYIYIYIAQSCAHRYTMVYLYILIIYISTYGSSLRNVMDSNQTYGTFHHQTRPDRISPTIPAKKKGPSCCELLINHPSLISYIFKLTNIQIFRQPIRSNQPIYRDCLFFSHTPLMVHVLKVILLYRTIIFEK